MKKVTGWSRKKNVKSKVKQQRGIRSFIKCATFGKLFFGCAAAFMVLGGRRNKGPGKKEGGRGTNEHTVHSLDPRACLGEGDSSPGRRPLSALAKDESV